MQRLLQVNPSSAIAPECKAGPTVEAACWARGRRKFFDLARLTKAPIAAEAVKRIDVLFALIEREIKGPCATGAPERGFGSVAGL